MPVAPASESARGGSARLLGPAKRLGGRLGRGLLDALLPPRCLSCGAVVQESGQLCARCWPRLAFLAPPFCACCGLPFGHEQGPGTLCGACNRQPPAFARARAVLRYDEASRGMILAFKHADRTDAAPAFARWLARAGAELIAETDLVLPVPLHPRRLFRRRYNQAALLAQALGRLSDRPVAPDLLRRRRDTPPQGHRSRGERQRNVAGAFALAPGAEAAIEGRRLLLVDDVFTTGATLEAACRPLLAGGAAAVDCLALARVVMASA